MKEIKTVAIIGAGPSGSVTAYYLAKQGKKVLLFGDTKRPELIIGESLVPAIIPYLKELEVEDEIRSFSEFKPGATFHMRENTENSFFFNREDKWGKYPSYAYNVPRKKFDNALLQAAIKAGVSYIPSRAKVISEDGKALLSEETIRKLEPSLSKQPDFIIDATGRSRSFSKLFDIKSIPGKRKDVALFSHLDYAPQTHIGNIHIDRLKRGWSWRIPLPDKMSLGIVAPQEYINSMGATAEEQYDNILKTDKRLAKQTDKSKRLTKVMKYNNYQLSSEKMYGKNWALVGDSAGFIDPVFSSGLLIAFSSSKKLGNALNRYSNKSMLSYENSVKDELRTWQNLVDYYYDGRLFATINAGEELKKRMIGKIVSPHIELSISRIFTGTSTSSTYSKWLLNFLVKHSVKIFNPIPMRIR